MPSKRSFQQNEYDGKEHVNQGNTSPEELLRERFQEFCKQYDFAKGDLVQWKPGMKNRRLPKYGSPAIVVEVLAKPKFDTSHNSGSPYFEEPLDLLLGFVDDDEDFVILHYDKRRFMPYKQ